MSTSTQSSILIQALDRLKNLPLFHILFTLNIKKHDDVLVYRDTPGVLAELTQLNVSCVRMIINAIDEIQLYPENVYPSFVHPIVIDHEPDVKPELSDDETQNSVSIPMKENQESDILNGNENIHLKNYIKDTNDNSNDDIMETEEYNEENDDNTEGNKSNNKNKESEMPKIRSKRLMEKRKKKQVSNYSGAKNKRKTSKSHLKMHAVKHSDEKPFSCTECNFASRRKHNLTRHIKIHAKNKPYQCLKCKKRFAEISAYKKHVKRNKCVRVNQ